MSTIKFPRLAVGSLLAAACLIAGTQSASAASLGFHVDLTGIATGGAAPYALNFQLAQGQAGFNPTTVTLSNFSFTGGSVSGSPDFSASTGSGASGTAGTSFVLNVANSNTFSDILQGFTAGTSLIGFDVSINTDVTTGSTIPDAFSVYILDNAFNPLATNAPDSSNFFLKLDINQDFTLGDIATFSGSGVGASISAVPEPSTYGLMGAGAAAAVALVRRRRKAAAKIAA